MATEPYSAQEIASDYHFITLASCNTTVEAFSKSVEEDVVGYKQKRRLVEGLRALAAKVDEVEAKLSVIKAVGKAKQLEDADLHLCNTYAAYNLRDKIAATNASLQTQIEEGRIATDEKPAVLVNLQSRRDKAKADNKEKALEKLERNISLVCKMKPWELPVANLMSIHKLNRKVAEIEALQKRVPKSLSGAQRDSIEKKGQVEEEIAAMHRQSRVWFESELEFKRRLEHALVELLRNEEEMLRKEQEEAWDRALEEERKAVEEKRIAAERKREEEERKLEEKLEAKRIEAQAKPQKAAPQPKKKEKQKMATVNPYSLFVAPSELRQRAESEEEAKQALEGPEDQYDYADEEEEEPVKPAAPKLAAANGSNGYPASAPPASQAAVPAVAPAPVAAPKEKAKAKPKPKVVLENKWGDAPRAPDGATEEDEAAGPTLMDAVRAEAPVEKKKQPPPPPRKKEKKQFSKVSVADLGFDANNPNAR